MASVNTAFKVENGLLVVGDATITNAATVNASLTINASLITNTVASNLTPATNLTYTLGNSTARFTGLFAQSIDTVGSVTLNAASFSVLSITNATATTANLTLRSNNTQVFQNVTFDTDLLFLDAENNRIGFKTTSPSASDLITFGTGNLFFSVSNTALRFAGAVASKNAAVAFIGDSSNVRFTVTTYDSSNLTVRDGGFAIVGTNSTLTQTLLTVNGGELSYKSGNVSHSGNFGIYNVSGTRVGP